MTPAEMNQHMKQLIEGWVLQGHLLPTFFFDDFYEGNIESYKLINEELAFKFSDDLHGEWYSWERAAKISGHMRSCALFKAAKFLYKRGWYSQFSRKTNNAPWVHIDSPGEACPEVTFSTFQEALKIETLRTMTWWVRRHSNFSDYDFDYCPNSKCSAPAISDKT